MLCVACDHIADDAQLIYVKPEAAQRVVLLEDFTGQRCVNCPLGTDIIEQLQAQYGDSVFVAVGIHSGPLGFKGTAKAVGLATELGDEYYQHWNLEYQPVGLVNRRGAVNYTDWTRTVAEELAKPAPLALNMGAELADGQINISVELMGTDGDTQGRLQVWVLEDALVAMQLMPDGTANADYVHNHVLRTAVNGAWGQDVSVREGLSQTVNLTQRVDAAWQPQHLSVVAFVYNDQGVQQAVKVKVHEVEQ